MTRKVAHWLAVAVGLLGLFSRPAEGYIIGSLMISEGWGESYTELDYDDAYYDSVIGAYVSSELSYN